jgi:transposase-like protein
MTSTKPTTTNGKPERKKRTPSPQYQAADKVQAVLAVWTERCKPADVCRQLGINWITFNHWQRRAMEGMLQALENRVNLAKGEALSPRLQTLLQHRQRTLNPARLSQRLEQVNKLASSPVETAKTA